MENIHNPEISLAFDFVEYTNRNIFLTGNAGTGKTTFLHNLRKKSPKRMIVVAPTGVAAINAGGVTIHSFFQMPFGPHIPQTAAGSDYHDEQEKKSAAYSVKKFSRDKIQIMKSLDLLVIDEISMVRADLLDGIDEVLRKYRDRYKPFGGVQLLMIGDLQQLAPVAKEDEWDLLKQFYDTVFFFSSKALQMTNYVTIGLKHIYRQNDAVFIGMLNKIRDNSLDEETLVQLNKRYIPGFALKSGEGYIILTTHNYQAREINESKLKTLKSSPRTFTASVTGDFPEYSYPTDFELTLKIGAQVMFVKNDTSREKLFFNGKIGVIESFDDDTIYVNCPADTESIPVERLEWDNTKYTIDDETKEIKENIAGTFKQYPLKLAWAITIHKSQGLTFEKAIIDANAAFAHGQVYVALSRCKTLEGLVLSSPISFGSIKYDSKVARFSNDAEQNKPGEQVLAESKNAYEKDLLIELFDFTGLQRRINYLLKLLNEHFTSLHESDRNLIADLSLVFKNELLDVSEKFLAQVRYLCAQPGTIEENTALQERVIKASTWFADKTKTIIADVIQNLVIETDNKTIRKSVNDALDYLRQDTMVKLACLNGCKSGFVVKKYLDVRAKAAIEKEETKHAYKKSGESAPAHLPHPKLYSTLKAWRENMANEQEMESYLILPQKTMIELVTSLPATKSELKEIKGIGKKKLKQFGDEILEIIAAYRIENKIEKKPETPKVPKKIASGATATQQASFDLFKSGKTLAEVAAARVLSVSTIEGHLAHFVLTGKLDVKDFVSVEKIKLITDYFLQAEDTQLGPAKAVLGDEVSYSDLHFVRNFLVFKGEVSAFKPS
jgi:hypothetical protein